MHCLYIERVSGEENAEEICCISVGRVRCGVIKQQVRECHKKRADKRLLKIVKKQCNKETVILANERAMKDFKMQNTLFYLRKQELLQNIGRITVFLQSQIAVKKRKKLLLVLHSENWSRCEIMALLFEIINSYEDIYIVYQTKKTELESIAEHLYREFGAVLHLNYEEDGRSLDVDTVFFLVKEWNAYYQQFGYRNGYVIAEQDVKLRRKKMGDIKYDAECISTNRMLYAGLVYRYEGKDIPYELALPIVYHDGLRYVTTFQKEEKAISVVAIYGLE